MTHEQIGPSIGGKSLLGPNDAEPVLHFNPAGSSDWLLLCDHAGNDVPRVLGDLGLARADLDDHIGVDIGAWGLTRLVGAGLDAQALGQRYSRLVIDANRQPGTPTSIPKVSDRRQVPANIALSEEDARQRVETIFAPYHRAIAASIAAKSAPVLCAVHSFTRQLGDHRRLVDIGIIHGPQGTLADALLESLSEAGGLRVERNQPYQIDFAGDYSLPVHGERRGLPYVELEICQDLIAMPAGQARIAKLLVPALRQALHDSRL